ncbi:uncharacterized protein EKO05_0011202 [Ascochyta rabiei]|uniref:uncharacterized protein n=1 Tax=Didymella rabiei TaxID=5454 RepID=UPI002203E6AC|nr:uncharacterized protein EKO05_0011202 [Ascochyta rabiei]UPX20996.1 hypothetical protein EKO05_0011202 [Ascochyta rabiei]
MRRHIQQQNQSAQTSPLPCRAPVPSDLFPDPSNLQSLLVMVAFRYREGLIIDVSSIDAIDIGVAPIVQCACHQNGILDNIVRRKCRVTIKRSLASEEAMENTGSHLQTLTADCALRLKCSLADRPRTERALLRTVDGTPHGLPATLPLLSNFPENVVSCKMLPAENVLKWDV